MPANTPKGYPYPVGTDRVADGDNAIQALAEKVDAAAGVAAAGTVSFSGAASGVNYPIAVTFPVGRFTVAPTVLATPSSGFPLVALVASSGTTTSGTTITGARQSGTGAFTAGWFAVQI